MFTSIAIVFLSLGLIGTAIAGILRSQTISDLAEEVARLEMKVDYLNKSIDNYKREKK